MFFSVYGHTHSRCLLRSYFLYIETRKQFIVGKSSTHAAYVPASHGASHSIGIIIVTQLEVRPLEFMLNE